MKNIDEAIWLREAVRLSPHDGSNLPTHLNDLGVSFMCRFERFWEVKDIDEAIMQHHEAARLVPRTTLTYLCISTTSGIRCWFDLSGLGR